MKFNFVHIFLYIVIVLLTTFTSCQEEDFGFTKEDVRAGVYNRNFDNYYGKVAPDQIWDFSTYNLNRLGLEGGPSAALTRAGEQNPGVVVTRAVQDDGSIVVYEEIKKRYMIEDRGSLVDWDFNDIVVDVIQTTKTDASNNKTTETKASVVCLRGTIPFKVTIGTTLLGGGVFANDVDREIPQTLINQTIEGWNPSNNNISITVWPDCGGFTQEEVASANLGSSTQSNDVYQASSFSFPAQGDHPYIIATDVTTDIMGEGVNVPQEWLLTAPAYYRVSVSSNNDSYGTVSLSPNSDDLTSGNYQNGTTITLNASPNNEAGYRFIRWEKDNQTVSNNVEYSFVLDYQKQGDYVAVFDTESDGIVISTQSTSVSCYQGNFAVQLDPSQFHSYSGNANAVLTIYYESSNIDYNSSNNISSEGTSITLTDIKTQNGYTNIWEGNHNIVLGENGSMRTSSFKLNELWKSSNSAIVLIFSGNTPGTLTITKVTLTIQ